MNVALVKAPTIHMMYVGRRARMDLETVINTGVAEHAIARQVFIVFMS